MTTKLSLWNNSLGELGHRRLSDTGEAVEAGRELTAIHDQVLGECLAAGPWNFAMETVAPQTSDGAGATFGYTHRFTKPSTWIKTEALASDSGFTAPVLAYYEDGTYWSADTGQLFIRYVSDDTGKGLDLPSWPAAFTRYAELELAYQACMRFTQSLELKERIGKDRDTAKKAALEQDGFRAAWPSFTSTTTTRARLLHSALLELGDLGKVSVAGEDARRALDRLYDEVVAECIAAGSWNFAMETIQADADTGVTPSFGYPEVFAKPTDWVRTIAISQDENFAFPLLHYYDDDNFWSADSTPIYVRYVSNDTGLGMDLQRWTPHFSRFVILELALRGSETIIQNLMASVMMRAATGEGRSIDHSRATQIATVLGERLKAKRDKARKTALNQDALNEPNPKFPPPSSWTLARGGRSGRDRGSRGSLIG